MRTCVKQYGEYMMIFFLGGGHTEEAEILFKLDGSSAWCCIAIARRPVTLSPCCKLTVTPP